MSATTIQSIDADTKIAIEHCEVAAYTIPTDAPESDGTLAWNSTTIVTVHVMAAGKEGFGYTYAPPATARFVRDSLFDVVSAENAFATEACWQAMVHAVRNAGQLGITMCAISAVDTALWDLKSKLLNLPLCQLWGMVRESAPIYGSGGFTSYNDKQLQKQLGNWAAKGFTRVKMKVGRDAPDDVRRVTIARKSIGDDVQLFVDANGGYERKQALRFAEEFAERANVCWFEEPRPSDDLEGLRLLRDWVPAGMQIAAGEYGYTLPYFRRMMEAGAIDCLQADATRCGGFTGLFKVASLCEANALPLSTHCAPYLHLHAACCLAPLVHAEYFHDHARIAELCFDGYDEPQSGSLVPNLSRPGHGLAFKKLDAQKYAV
jgi:L-alanine-DL-glutamate epimerase-like enolase superfamily enzyme